MQITPKLNLKKPDLTDSINVQDLNDNMDVLDTAVSELQEGSASIPDLETNDKTLAGAINEIKQTVNDVGTNAKEYTDQQTAAIDTKLDTHIKDDSGHVRFIGNATGGDGMACRTDLAPVDLVNGKLVPKHGHAFRFFKVDGPNTGPATLALIADTMPGNPSSISYPILNSGGQALKGGEMAKNGIYTLAFNGTAFFLQGNGSGVTARNNRDFNTPGTHLFEVPKGVSKITAYIWGAGGGGGGNKDLNGGGGGGGAFLMAVVDVTPGEKFNVTVGQGGVAGSGSYSGSVGGSSGFTLGSTQYVAGGGGGGTYGGQPNWGKGGRGGLYASNGLTGNAPALPESGKLHPFVGLKPSNLLYCFTGGDGGPGGNYGGGGGGGSASDMSGGGGADTTNGAGKAGAIYSNFKGADGGGGAYQSEGRNGVYPGGGGSGSGHAAFGGGHGASGRVIFYW
ncbi:hypothetical protein D0439_20085 [Lysinibacillus fusiformis]|uniref:glycine-rich domain-containing protein n=1 Tax=Lysinibacillus fusiformis TaxID=28031 RepID=UPI0011BB6F84|nr:hypothetical protein [Lysinibacillus fusiformis]QEA00812.1 hypothetical protein D0439_20085 [Lysinibacillus fusiformis]